SAWQFLAPLCLASLILGIICVTVLNPLSAAAYARAEAMEGALRGRTISADSARKVTWLRQTTEEGTSIVGALNSAERGRILFNEDGTLRDRLDARRAVLVDGAWELHDVTIYRAGADRERQETLRIRSGLKLEFIEEQLTRPESIPFFELSLKIEAAKSFGL